MEMQPTAEDVILSIVEKMHESLEPLLYTTLAPSLFHVFLRRRDYERRKGLFTAMTDEARQALDRELDELNGVTARPPWYLFFMKFFSKARPKKYLKPKEGWNISFGVDDDLPDGEKCRVDAILTAPSKVELAGGSKTIRAESVRLPEGSKTLRPAESARDSREQAAEAAERVYALISYTDEGGPQSYMMKKSQIKVGRGSVEYWVDLKLNTKSDVSHEHLWLRYDEQARQFFIKDMSTFGTSVDGAQIPASVEVVNGEKRDKNVWVELPGRARIDLAGVLQLDFAAEEGR